MRPRRGNVVTSSPDMPRSTTIAAATRGQRAPPVRKRSASRSSRRGRAGGGGGGGGGAGLGVPRGRRGGGAGSAAPRGARERRGRRPWRPQRREDAGVHGRR